LRRRLPARTKPGPLAAERRRGRRGAPAEYECDGLTVSAADLDLGEVWNISEFIRDLAIRNKTGADKKIEDFATSCFCTAVEPRRLTIPAGGAATVHVRIDPNHRSPDEANLAARPFAVEIKPIQDVSLPHRAGWTMHGLFKSRVTLNVLTVHFGQDVAQGAPPPTRTVLATVHMPFQRLAARLEPPSIGTVDVGRDAVKPDRAEIRITPSNTLPTGPFKGAVVVDVVDMDGNALPGATLPVAGDVQPGARLLPARVILGAHPVGTAAETVVVLQAPADAAWTVDRIETDSADIFVEATTAEGIPTGRAFRVRQKAAREGNQTDTVRFVVRKGGGPPITLPMEVTCLGELPHGTSPEIGVKHP